MLTLLASARRGLSERELQELVAGLAAADDLFPVLRQLRPYLLSRAGLIDFYHLSLARAVGECYLGSPTKKGVMHARLAEYFRDKPDWQRAARSGDARRANARKADELPWQLLQAEQWDGLRQCLTDIGFLEAKCAAGMTYALLEDFAAGVQDQRGTMTILLLVLAATALQVQPKEKAPFTVPAAKNDLVKQIND